MQVLVVESDLLVRFILGQGIEEAGHEAVFKTGQGALEAFETDPYGFGALILSMQSASSPSAWKMAQQARELNPDIPIILLTKRTAQVWYAEMPSNSIILQRPVLMSEITRSLRKLIPVPFEMPDKPARFKPLLKGTSENVVEAKQRLLS